MSRKSRLMPRARAWPGAVYACVLMGFTVGAAPAARAGVVTGDSSAFGVSADLSAGLASLSVAPTPDAFGSAPPPYSTSDFLANFNASSGSLASLIAEALSVAASSDVDGGIGPRLASASADVTGMSTVIIDGVTDLVNLTAEMVTSDASVSGDFGALIGSGDSTFTNAVLSVSGVNFIIVSNPAPNTVLFSGGGLDIVLNEQIVTGDGTSARGIEVNAIHLTMTDVPSALGLLNGDVIWSHSEASLNAIPEPPTLVLLAVGLAAMLKRRRRLR